MHALLGRMLYACIKPVWRRVAKDRPRSRILLLKNDQVLLVRNWLSSQRWRMPGGGRQGHEEPVDAAVRELREELRLQLTAHDLSFLGTREVSGFGTTIQAEFFVVDARNAQPKPNPREIIAMQWFPIDNLPDDRSAVVDNAIALYREKSGQPRGRNLNQ